MLYFFKGTLITRETERQIKTSLASMLNLLAFSRSPLAILRFMLLCTFQQSSPVKESRFALGISLRSSSFKCSILCKDEWNIKFEELSLSKQRGILYNFPQFIWLLLATVLENLLKTNLKRRESIWRRTYWLKLKSKFFPDSIYPSGVWREELFRKHSERRGGAVPCSWIPQQSSENVGVPLLLPANLPTFVHEWALNHKPSTLKFSPL